jgi:hypothetical protein
MRGSKGEVYNAETKGVFRARKVDGCMLALAAMIASAASDATKANHKIHVLAN